MANQRVASQPSNICLRTRSESALKLLVISVCNLIFACRPNSITLPFHFILLVLLFHVILHTQLVPVALSFSLPLLCFLYLLHSFL